MEWPISDFVFVVFWRQIIIIIIIMNTTILYHHDYSNKTSNSSVFNEARAIRLLIEKQRLALFRMLEWHNDFVTGGYIARTVQYFLTMTASFVIICAIIKYKNLYTTSNLFIAALALGKYQIY